MEQEINEITGVSYILTCINTLNTAIYDYVYNLYDIFRNTLEDDIGYPDFESFYKRFTESYQGYNQTLQPFFEQMIGQLQLATVFSSLILPIAMVIFVWTYCCCASEENDYDDIDGTPIRGTKQSNTCESQRWFRQATYDLQAALYDLEQVQAAPEWTCFKCQQAAEKAIKAAVISKGLHNSKSSWFGGTQTNTFGHDLHDNAAPLRDACLQAMAQDLQREIGFVGRMRYPDKHPYPKVPRDAFSRQQALQALSKSTKIVNYVASQYLQSHATQ